jgi:cell division septal protein FtsQ
VNGWHSGRGSGRQGMLPVELPPRTDAGAPPRAADPERRLVAPPASRATLPRLALRIAVGSIGLALAVGVAVGRLTALEGASPVSDRAPAELRIRGAGHLNALSDPEVLGAGGLLADAAAIRERLLATGVPKKVSVERALTGGVLVDIEEKRAVALLDWEPPAALAEDGTVLGPATVADLAWAGAADLVLVRGADRSHRDFAARASLAGRLAAALSRRPELDRLVSELDVSGGPYRLRVVFRSPALPVLLTERGFLEGLERTAGLLPDLVERWPGISRVDARVPDRFLVRTGPPDAAPQQPAHPVGGQT